MLGRGIFCRLCSVETDKEFVQIAGRECGRSLAPQKGAYDLGEVGAAPNLPRFSGNLSLTYPESLA